MKLRLLTLALFLTVPALGACGNGGASEPPVTSVDPGAVSKLQFAVGIATISKNNGQSIATGVNTVLTLRQQNGLSGVLYSIPQIIGPSNFHVLISTQTGNEVQAAGADLGTNHITWATLNQTLWTGPARGIKAATTGAFGYGFCPCNSDAGPITGTTSLYQAFNLPVYGDNPELFYGGPPAFPAGDVTLTALGFQGYSLGFTDFAVQPALGAYHLYAAVPPADTTPANPTPSPDPNGTPTPAPGVLAATAQINSLAGLPVFTTPAFAPDGNGGGTVTVTVPKGVREAAIVFDATGQAGTDATCAKAHLYDTFFTIVTHKSGMQKLQLGDTLGPKDGSGQPTHSICPGGTYKVYAAGFDYGAYEASYPSNLSQTPTISGPHGQADVTTSDFLEATYP